MLLNLFKYTVFALFWLSVNNVHAMGGAGDLGGGGAVLEDETGKLHTWGDLGLVIREAKKRNQIRPIQEVPYLEEFKKIFGDGPTINDDNIYLPHGVRKIFMESLTAKLGQRNYYDAENLDPKAAEWIIDLYEKNLEKMKFTNRDSSVLMRVKLPAVTFGTDTYFLPGFTQLGKFQKMALVLHEAIWAAEAKKLIPKVQLEDLMKFEASFQTHLEDSSKLLGFKFGFNRDFYYMLGRILHRPITSLEAAFYYDVMKVADWSESKLRSKTPFYQIDREYDHLRISARDLFGEPFNLQNKDEIQFDPNGTGCRRTPVATQERRKELQDFLEIQIDKYPDLNFYSVVMDDFEKFYFAPYDFKSEYPNYCKERERLHMALDKNSEIKIKKNENDDCLVMDNHAFICLKTQ